MRLSRLRRGQERYYLETVASGAEDHRAPGLEPDGVWMGRGAGVIGLAGRVDGAALAAVLDGADPATGEKLSPTHGRVKVVGLDLTFAAPKQVSLLFGLGSPRTAGETAMGHEAAVAASIGYLERRAVWVRRARDGGRWALPTEGVVAGAFLHHTSRLADPHVHSHVLVANLAQGADGRWSALDTRGLYAHAAAAGWLYGAHLRAELSSRLGVEFVPDAEGRPVIAGMEPRLSRAFSQRRLQVESQLAAWGATGESASSAAALATRPEKDLAHSSLELRQWWRERASGMGMGAEGADRFVGRGALAEPGRPDPERLASTLFGPGGALSGVASFSRPELLQALCGALASGAAVTAVEEVADVLLRSDLVVARGEPTGPGLGPGSSPAASGQEWRLSGGPRGRAGPGRWASSARHRAEEATLARVVGPGPAEAGSGSSQTAQRALARRPGLSPLEQAAVRDLAATCRGVVVLDGPVASRHDVLDAAREAWEAAGRTILGTAPSRAHAAQLASLTGIPCFGPQALGLSGEGAGAGRSQAHDQEVIVVSGAEALDHRHLDRLLDATEGATLVLAGRLSGPPWPEDAIVARLARRQAAISLGPARTAATDGWSPPAGDAVAVGLGEGGTVTFSPSAGSARARVVEEWLAESSGDAGAASAMVAERGEVARLNGLARAHLLQLGRLGGTVVTAPQPLAHGERLVARWGSARSGLSAGQAVTVETLDATARRLVVRSDDGHHLVPLSDVQRGQLAYRYALSPADAARAGPVRLLVLGAAEGLAILPGGTRGEPAPEVRYHVVAGAEVFPSAGRPVERDRVLGAAAEVATPPGVVALIGQPPDEVAGRAVWRRAAATIEGYRERFGQELSGPAGNAGRESREPEARPGGGGPDDLRRAVERADALAAVRAARHRLGLEQGREPSLSRSREGIGLSR